MYNTNKVENFIILSSVLINMTSWLFM